MSTVVNAFNFHSGFVSDPSTYYEVLEPVTKTNKPPMVLIHGGAVSGASKATMKQDPSVQLQGFLRYQLAADWDLRGGLSHTFGGETEVGGVNQDDRIKTSKFTLGTSWFVTPTLQFIVNYGRDIEVENGFEEQHRLNLRVLKIL